MKSLKQHRKTLSCSDLPWNIFNLTCECSVCSQYFLKQSSEAHYESPKSLEEKYKWADWGIADFNWFLERLAEVPDIPSTLSLKIPETAIWDQGTPLCIIKMANDNKVIKLSSVYMDKTFIQQHFGKGDRSPRTHYCIRGSCCKCLELHRLKYRFVLRVRPREECSRDHIALLTEKMLCDILTKLPRKKLKQIKAFSSYIKSGREIGAKESKVVRVKYAPYLSSEHLDKSQQPRKCLEIVSKLSELIKKHCRLEILEMNAEFYIVSNNYYWLNDVWQVIYRKCNDEPVKVEEKSEDLTSYMVNDKKYSELLQRLHNHGENAVSQAFGVQPLIAYMDKHLNEIKDALGVETSLNPVAPDFASNVALKKLRPGCPYEFTELLSPHKLKSLSKKLKPVTRGAKGPEISQAILYNAPLNKPPKIKISKKEYASFVVNELRTMQPFKAVKKSVPEKPKLVSHVKSLSTSKITTECNSPCTSNVT